MRRQPTPTPLPLRLRPLGAARKRDRAAPNPATAPAPLPRSRRPPAATLLVATLLAALTALATLAPAGGALAAGTTTTTTTPAATSGSEEAAPVTGTTTVPAPPSEPPSSQVAAPTTTTGVTPNPNTPPPTTTTTTAATTTPAPAPEVRTQSSQPPTVAPAPSSERPAKPAKSGAQAHENAVAPSALTPPLPSTLDTSSFLGVPSFFIDSFSIPPFLLPLYQAAGAAYGIPWQVLAAINEVETDYGRDLNVSSAGAEGWMQFLPSEWLQYGVDVNDDGFEDPYNPADAIFAAARYLKDAGGDTNIRAAVFAYNHSQAYVNSVMLRARLLGGTPPELLGAITGLTEGRFPVYAASHYSDSFPLTEEPTPRTVPGTTIHTQPGAPVIAVQDGRITGISRSGPLGLSVSLTDAYGNTYTYSELGTLATLYPVLESTTPASPAARAAGVASAPPLVSPASVGATSVFRAGSENVYLHPLRVGVQVIAGTVLGHVGASAEPHMVFQIRPAGADAPLIDPKPILDSWVKLQSSSVIKPKGRNPFATISATPGQTLLESNTQLEQQVPRDHGVHLPPCERRLIADGLLDRQALATLAFLAASGFDPTVSKRSCPRSSRNAQNAVSVGAVASAVDISAVNGVPVADANNSDVIAAAVRKLGELQGAMKPLQIASSTPLGAAAAGVVSLPGYSGLIQVSFASLGGGGGEAHAAGVTGSGLTPSQWLALVARLGEVPDPTVSATPSPAAIPDGSSAGSSAGSAVAGSSSSSSSPTSSSTTVEGR